MNKFSKDAFDGQDESIKQDQSLTCEETAQLRAILRVVTYDTPSETLRIEVGGAKVLVRGDGHVRIEGKRVVQMSQGSIVLDGAAIELN